MDINIEPLPLISYESAQTGTGTPTNEVVGDATKHGTSKTNRNPWFDPARTLRKELKIVPLHLWQANELVAQLHRHSKPIRVHKFSIGCSKDGVLCGAAICMRPACRALDDGKTLEVCRLVTDGTHNACSLLYSTCAKISKLMGFLKIQSYILDSEPGTSLKAAGWTLEKTGCGGTPQGKRTNRPNGHEVTPITFATKQRWAKLL
ncbi:MAG: XF1762 family protein [Terracidiphilus sp.]